jgi:hypothetical protein
MPDDDPFTGLQFLTPESEELAGVSLPESKSNPPTDSWSSSSEADPGGKHTYLAAAELEEEAEADDAADAVQFTTDLILDHSSSSCSMAKSKVSRHKTEEEQGAEVDHLPACVLPSSLL